MLRFILPALLSYALFAYGAEAISEPTSHELDGQAFAFKVTLNGIPTPDGLVFADGEFTSGCIESMMLTNEILKDSKVELHTLYHCTTKSGKKSFKASLRLLPTERPKEVPEEFWNQTVYEGTIDGDKIEGEVSWMQAGIPIFEPAAFTGRRVPGKHSIEDATYWRFELGNSGDDTVFSSDRVDLIFEGQKYTIQAYNQHGELGEIGGYLFKITGSCPFPGAVKDDAITYADGALTIAVGKRVVKIVDKGTRLVVDDKSFNLDQAKTTIVIPVTGDALMRPRPK